MRRVTVAVAVKVYDGIVLATDSATSLGVGSSRPQVYNHAHKVFHLHRDLPLGAMTWGLGEIGGASIATITKDFRRRVMGLDPSRRKWKLPPWYTVEQVADRLVEMVFGELYSLEVPAGANYALGFLVAGFSANGEAAEAWEITMDDPSARPTPVCVIPSDVSGWGAWATPQPTQQLFNAIDPGLSQAILQSISIDAERQRVAALIGGASQQPAVPGMPFADALNLGRFLVDVTTGWSRFIMGPDTVGGPVQLAGITRHEGFKWVEREHYYPAALNPRGERHRHDHD